MDGIHDMGGMDGFGRMVVEPNEPVFHAPWEGRVFAIAAFVSTNTDAFRHAIERLDPVAYLTLGYYGRWLAAVERLLVEQGVLGAGEVEARLAGRAASPGHAPLPARPASPGALRTIDGVPRFAVGQTVVARNLHPAGHTRLPGYVRGRYGVIVRVHPAFVLPDTNAHGRGENPQYVYAVRFAARELWGDEADPRASVHVDLFESYLEAR